MNERQESKEQDMQTWTVGRRQERERETKAGGEEEKKKIICT